LVYHGKFVRQQEKRRSSGISGLSFGEETGAEAATISKNLVQPRLKRHLRVSRKQHCPPLCRRRPSAFSG